ASTVDAVCGEAGLSKKYFYEDFHTRDELFAALAEQLIDKIITGVIGSVGGPDVDLLQRLRDAFGCVVALLVDDPRNARLFTEVVGSDLLVDTLGSAERKLAGLLVDTILAHIGGTLHERKRLHVVALVIIVGTAQAVTDWLDGAIELSRADLVDELATMSTAAARTIRPDL
ncbi:MAG: TetR/AcrR family transcriptional regulator, partial [Actinobacteria bacterium]|nr:TetR/AcrR family transcriptional regulator [Actinomycetota bacterium]